MNSAGYSLIPSDEPSGGSISSGHHIQPLPHIWMKAVDMLDFAFQPIVNPLTGLTFGVEALLRNVKAAGFDSIADVFDSAYEEKLLYAFDIELRRKAVKKFSTIGFCRRVKLFYNYDPRVHEMPDYGYGATESILRENSLSAGSICFELSEQHKVSSNGRFKNFLTRSRERGFKIALDDFGAGFAGLELFYHSEPDFLKFDRFLICNIDSDLKKRTFCTHIINLAKLLGVVVIAEGLETEKEFLTCKDLGFDLVQGYFIQVPVSGVHELSLSYGHIKKYEERNMRRNYGNARLVIREMDRMDTVKTDDGIEVLFSKFHRNSRTTFFPVLDLTGFPVGIIHERSLKKYIYSPFGYDLLRNKSLTASLQMFIEKCPIADIHMPQEKILEIFANNPDSEGVIITEELRYAGFLTAKSLLNILHEMNLAVAREMNPLTKLPGNLLITRYIADTLSENDRTVTFVYFDFNNFKPFNDRCGFRQGDRVILLFAEMLVKDFSGSDCFVGHIGGDDFFAGIRHDADSVDPVIRRVEAVIERFDEGVAAFYESGEVCCGVYRAADRDGEIREFPILSVSAALLSIPAGNHSGLLNDIASRLAGLKNLAKRTGRKLAVLHLSDMERE